MEARVMPEPTWKRVSQVIYVDEGHQKKLMDYLLKNVCGNGWSTKDRGILRIHNGRFSSG